MPMLHKLEDNESKTRLDFNECAISVNPNANIPPQHSAIVHSVLLMNLGIFKNTKKRTATF